MAKFDSPGLRIMRARIERGWSGKELSNRSGVSRTALWSIEFGKSKPRPGTLLLIASALDLTVAQILGDDWTPADKKRDPSTGPLSTPDPGRVADGAVVDTAPSGADTTSTRNLMCVRNDAQAQRKPLSTRKTGCGKCCAPNP